jgi:hypothetical protein
MDQIGIIIGVFNFILLIGLTVGTIRWQKSHGKLSQKKVILIVLGFFCYNFISLMIPIFLINPGATIIIIIGFLLVWWGLVYPIFCWAFKQFNQPK